MKSCGINVYISYTCKPILSMKELTIFIPQEKLFEVTEILQKHNVAGLTFTDVMGVGRTKHDPIPEQVRMFMTGKTIIPDFVKGSKVETIVGDSEVKAIVDDILISVTEGKHAHGRIFVKDVSDLFVLGSNVHGEDALKI